MFVGIIYLLKQLIDMNDLLICFFA
jgi:hypothetical protein